MKEREETEEYERGENEEEKENEEEADDLWSNLLVLSVKQISLLGNIVQEIIV